MALHSFSSPGMRVVSHPGGEEGVGRNVP